MRNEMLVVRIFLAMGIGWAMSAHLAHSANATPHHQPNPMTLQEVMQELSGHYLQLVAGILGENFHQIGEAAMHIAHHPLPAPLNAHLRTKLGKRYDGFVQMDLAAHNTAEAIHKAANIRDMSGVIRGNQALFSLCTECHQQYR